MKSVGIYEAKTHLTRLIEEVERGDSITITRHGRPVARLVPEPPTKHRSIRETIEAIEEFRRGHPLGDVTIRELIDEGRRF